MGVKTIFKTLVGMTAILIISFLILELINVATYSSQINQLTRIATKKACYFFANETYRGDIGILEGIRGNNGNTVVGGNIYEGSSEEDIYNRLYTNSNEFESWYQQHTDIWDNLDLLAYGLGIAGARAVTGEDELIAKYFKDVMVTPINLGVTYLDKDAIEKTMIWNLTALISNGEPANIVNNEGRNYVRYKGFRVYTTEAEIVSIDYKQLNVEDNADEVRRATGIENLSSMSFENKELLMAGIKYRIPIAYEGITPLSNVIEFANSYKVRGANGSKRDEGNNHLNIESAELESGGFEGNESNAWLPVKGDLTFIVTK